MKTAPVEACFSGSMVWLRIAAETTIAAASSENCWKTESPACNAIVVEKAPMNEPMLQLACSLDMIGVVPARSIARPLAFMQTSIEP